MRYLSSFLASEGNTDECFLPTLLQRGLEAICARHAESVIDIPEVQVLRYKGASDGGRVASICTAARAALDSIVVLFHHYDGATDPEREKRKYFDPLRQEWQGFAGGRQLVPVVPVREMEAWALADTMALDSVLGTRWRNTGVYQSDRLGKVEELVDPKRTLRELAATSRRPRRRETRPDWYLSLLAERVSLDALDRVPAYRRWCDDTVAALKSLEFFRG